MHIPKIEFREMTLEENINIIKWAYFENNDILSVHDYTIQYFSELDNLDSNLSRDEIYKIIEEVVTKNYNNSIEKIKKQTKRYNDLWENYNDKYFEELSLFFKIDWPVNTNKIIATVGLIPVFPRYLDNFSFSVNIEINDIQLIEICAHETHHFLWFEKWKQIFPKTHRHEFDSPYLVWQYSEMVTDPILNNEPFLDMFDFTEHSYDNFYKMYDGDSKVMDNLRNIYGKNISIEEKIKKGFEYIKNILEKEEITKK